MRVSPARTQAVLCAVAVVLFLFAFRALGQAGSAAPRDFARAGAEWTPIGPDGGDARSLSFDPENPNHLLLGTSSGDLFSSNDNGASWTRLAHLGSDHDLVLDHIVFDPLLKSIYIAAWSVEDNARGDLYRSRDGGITWQTIPGLHNKSIRSFVISRSNPSLMIAGALDGVFRSANGGESWQRISPEGHAEIHNIESLAVDPRNPDIIYAGTWHLPWKTEDGGRTWHSMKQGIIDDSDVFSIIIDHANPSTVYLSACSGIYKSDDAGANFHKVEGIPFSARRTRMLHQDPRDPNVVYAGTTEGLWRTSDGGAHWARVSAGNVIVNDISVDPRNSAHVLLATDRSGVLMSANSAASFEPSNRGFVHRQVTALVQDPGDPATVYAGVVNDKEYGGVFVTHDGGARWQQRSAGLNGRDIFVLRATPGGTILAGTNNGVFELARNGTDWRPVNEIVNERRIPVKVAAKGKSKASRAKTRTITRVEFTRGRITGRVSDIRVEGKRWYAATSQGLFVSDNDGKSWHGGPVLGNSSFVALNTAGIGQPTVLPQGLPQGDATGAARRPLIAATVNRVLISSDEGQTWSEGTLPVTVIRSVAAMPDSSLWVAAREGAFRSTDAGKHWERIGRGLPGRDIISIAAEPDGRRMIATAGQNFIYESTDAGESWHPTDTGWAVRSVTVGRSEMLGATAFQGVVVRRSNDRLRLATDSGNQ